MADGFPNINDLFPLPFPGGGSRSSGPKSTQQIQNEIRNMDQEAEMLGVPAEELQPRESLFSKFFNFLDKGKQVTMGLAEGAVTGKLFEDGLGKTIDNAFEKRVNAYDILREAGVESPWARAAIGFPVEVLMDPLTYTGVGLPRSLAKSGTGALTKTGLAKMDDLRAAFKGTGALVETGADAVKAKSFLEVEKLAEETFSSAGKYVELLESAKGIKDPYKKLLLGKEAELLKPKFAPYIDLADDELGKLFKRRQLEFSLSVPFLGHFQDGTKSAEFVADAGRGTVLKAFDKAKEFIKPVTFTKGMDVTPIANIIDNAKTSLAQQIHRFQNVPVVGPGIRGAVMAKEGVQAIGEAVGKIFSPDFFLGKEVGQLRHDLINKTEAAKRIALEDTATKFGKWLTPELEQTRKNAAVFYDSLASNVFDKAFSDPEKKKKFLETFATAIDDMNPVDAELTNKIISEFESLRNVPVGKGVDVDDFDITFDVLDIATKTGKITPETREIIDTAVAGFDELRKTELENGIKTKFLDYYIPHLVEKARGMSRQGSGGGAGFFLKGRKYETFGDLLRQGGLLAKTDIAEVYYKRKLASDLLIEQKKFMEQAVYAGQKDKSLIDSLYKKAFSDPMAARALRSVGLNPPRVDLDRALEAVSTFAGERPSKGLLAVPSAKALSESEQLLALTSIAEIRDQVVLKAKALGVNADDVKVSPQFFGDPGVIEKIGDKKVYLAPAFKNAIDEAVKSKDFVKTWAADSVVGSKMLAWSDWATNWARRSSTLPFPAYWMQNGFGSVLLSMADQGVGVLSPGRAMETLGVLNGKHGLRVAGGRTITPKEFNDVLKANAIRFTGDDFMSLIDSAGNLDLEKFVTKQKSLAKNIVDRDLTVVWDKATEKMQFAFEDFYRINQLAHELRKGSTVPAAVRSMNDVMLNYRNLTPAESSLFRRLYMFYPWTKQATAKTVNQLLLRPGAVTTQIKAARGMAETFSDPNALPSWEEVDRGELRDIVQREQISFSIGKDKDGKDVMGKGFGIPANTLLQTITAELPRNMQLTEVANAAIDSAIRTGQKQVASFNPLAKGVFELLSGKNFYFDKPLNDNFLRQIPKLQALAEQAPLYDYTHIPAEFIDATTKKLLKGVDNGKGGYIVDPTMFYLIANIIPGVGRAIGTANKFANPDLQNSQKLLHALTGVRVEPQDVERSAAYEELNEKLKFRKDRSIDQLKKNRREGIE